MKRIDRMTKEELYNSMLHSEYCKDDRCDKFEECTECIEDYYNEDTKVRFETIHSKEELYKLATEFYQYCSGRLCHDCKYYTPTRYINGRTGCFVEYLAEEVTE